MLKLDFSKFKDSVWHSAAAILCAVLAALILILGVNALKNPPKDEVATSSEISASAINAEKAKVESEGTKQ